ncbi:MAG: HypC/HybG/HupF family hydrogenase formation chaperone [Candidatus Bipolaricaulia bacterium]
MCLAIPALIKSVDGFEAEVDMGGISRRISIRLTPNAKPGDYVIVHTGYAINILDQDEAQETLRLFAQLEEASREGA